MSFFSLLLLVSLYLIPTDPSTFQIENFISNLNSALDSLLNATIYEYALSMYIRIDR